MSPRPLHLPRALERALGALCRALAVTIAEGRRAPTVDLPFLELVGRALLLLLLLLLLPRCSASPGCPPWWRGGRGCRGWPRG